MEAQKWTHPTTGQVRVYINSLASSPATKVYAVDEGDGYAKVIVEKAPTKKIEENLISAVRKNFGLYAKFEEYLSVAAEPKKSESRAYGSEWANGFAMANGYDYDEK